MDIVRIIMEGYGCEIHRGTVSKEKYKELEDSFDDIWSKDLIKKIEENKNVKKEAHYFGLINGDIKIEINDFVFIDTSISAFEALVNNKTDVIDYPNSKDVVVTSIQHQQGIFSDSIFVMFDNFDLNKITIIKKDIKNKVDNLPIASLYCELYYDGELIPMIDDVTDLRMSRLYFENTTENEKNKYRKF